MILGNYCLYQFLDLKNPLILIDNNLEDQKVNDLIRAYKEYIFLHNKNLNKKIKRCTQPTIQ